MLASNVEQTFCFTIIHSVRPIILHAVLHHQLEISLAITLLHINSTDHLFKNIWASSNSESAIIIRLHIY